MTISVDTSSLSPIARAHQWDNVVRSVTQDEVHQWHHWLQRKLVRDPRTFVHKLAELIRGGATEVGQRARVAFPVPSSGWTPSRSFYPGTPLSDEASRISFLTHGCAETVRRALVKEFGSGYSSEGLRVMSEPTTGGQWTGLLLTFRKAPERAPLPPYPKFTAINPVTEPFAHSGGTGSRHGWMILAGLLVGSQLITGVLLMLNHPSVQEDSHSRAIV